MNKIEKKLLKERYNKYKEAYNSLKKEIKIIPRGSVEYYEAINEMSGIKSEIAKIKLCLFSEMFRKIYLSNIFTDKKETERGGR